MFNLIAGSVISGSTNMFVNTVARFSRQFNDDGIWEIEKSVIAAGVGAAANLASEYFTNNDSTTWNDGGPMFAACAFTLTFSGVELFMDRFTDNKSFAYTAELVSSFIVSTGVHVFVKNNFSSER